MTAGQEDIIGPGEVHLAALPVSPKTGAEAFVHAGQSMGRTLQDFWRWSASDLLANTQRGVLAEYLVLLAVKACEPVRDPWPSFDLRTPDGITIEVKSTCAIQSWVQKGPSPLRFGVKATRGWDPLTGESEAIPTRKADAWVFCVLRMPGAGVPDPMDVDAWDFLVVPGQVLEARAPDQANVGLSTLLAWDVAPVSWSELDAAVRGCKP